MEEQKTISWSSAILKMINSFQLDEKEIYAVNEADNLKILPYILEKIFVSKNIDVPTNATTKDLKNIFIKEYFLLNDDNPSLNFNNEQDNLIFLTVLMFISSCKCESIQMKDILKMELVDDHSATALVNFFQTLIKLKIEKFTKNDVIQFVKKSMYVEEVSHQCSSPATPNGQNTYRQESSESPSFKIWSAKKLNTLKRRLEERDVDEEIANQKITKLEKKNAELKIQLAEKVKQNIKLKEDINFMLNMSCSNEEPTNELAGLQRNIKQLTAEIQGNKTDIDSLCTQRDSLHVKVKELKFLLDKKIEENIVLHNKNKEKDHVIATRESAIIENNIVITKLQASVGDLDFEMSSWITSMKSTVNEKLLEIQRLQSAVDDHVKEDQTLENQIKSIKAKIREEFEEKLTKLKIRTRELCHWAVRTTEKDGDKKLKKCQEEMKDHMNQLRSQLMTIKKENESLRSNKLKMENELLKYKNIIKSNDLKRRTKSYESLSPRTSSMRVAYSVDITTRSNVLTIPSGTGNVSPSEDKDEEIFSNEMLVDLEAGPSQVDSSPDPDSELQSSTSNFKKYNTPTNSLKVRVSLRSVEKKRME